MTKKEFNKKFKDGAIVSVVRFQKVLWEIMNSDEIDKIIKMAKFREKRWLKKFKAFYIEVAEDWATLPIVPLLMSIKSSLLYADIISRMIAMDDAVYRGEDEDE